MTNTFRLDVWRWNGVLSKRVESNGNAVEGEKEEREEREKAEVCCLVFPFFFFLKSKNSKKKLYGFVWTKGYEGFLSSKDNLRKRARTFKIEDRLFSLSSRTSPAAKEEERALDDNMASKYGHDGMHRSRSANKVCVFLLPLFF